MGYARWDNASRASYSAFTSSTAHMKTDEIYSKRDLHPDLDPLKIKVRESRDSAENPESTPIIVALDVTGSMGMLADTIARDGLGTLFDGILETKPVTDPHLMFMGVGDANCDRGPLQVSQFEANHSIIEQLTNLWLEKGGGGNDSESYHLPWYFAAFKTVHDAMEKRGKRGYLFTVGDEATPPPLTTEQLQRVVGDNPQRNLSAQELLELASRVYKVYHVAIMEGSFARHRSDLVRDRWTSLMGQNAIFLPDHTRLAETIVTTIRIAEGADHEAAAAHWADKSAQTASIVHEATKHLPRPSGL